jgi:hypothetical protein
VDWRERAKTACLRAPARSAALLLAGYVALLLSDVASSYDVIFLMPVLMGVGWILHRTPRLRAPVVTLGTLALVTAFLVNQWRTGFGGRHALVGGIIPWADATDFTSNAMRKVFGLPFNQVGSKRPLYPLLLALLLRVTGTQLRLVIALFAAAAAWLAARMTREIWQRTSSFGGVAAWFLLLLYLRRYLLVIGTESLGFILGGFAWLVLLPWLWRADSETGGGATYDASKQGRRDLVAAFAGFFSLTLALVTRAGPMFVLPALCMVLWQQAPRTRRWLRLGAALTGAVLAATLNQGAVKTSGEGVAFGDYPPIFYGMLHGEDFTYFSATHPGEDIRAVILRELSAEPWLLPLALIRSMAAFLVTPHGVFSLGFYNPDDRFFEHTSPLHAATELGPLRVANLLVMAAFAGAFTFACLQLLWRLRRRATRAVGGARLTAIALAAIVVSTGFTPPWVTEGAQLQATTLAFWAAVPGLWHHLRRAPHDVGPGVPDCDGITLLAKPSNEAWAIRGVALMCTLLGLAWAVPRVAPRALPGRAPSCIARDAAPEGSATLTVMPVRGVSVTRREGALGFSRRRFEANMNALRKNFDDLVVPLDQRHASGALADERLVYVFDRCSLDGKLLLVKASSAEAAALEDADWHVVRGQVLDRRDHILAVDEVQ